MMNQNVSNIRTFAARQQTSEGEVLESHVGNLPMPACEKTQRRNDWNKKQQSKKRAAARRAKTAALKQDKLLKKKILEVHGLFESIGSARDQTKKVAGHIETAKKLSAAMDGIKAALRYQGSSDDDLIENMICRLEDVTALIVALLNTQNYAGFIATLHMYIRTHYTKSTSKVVIDLISRLFRLDSEKMDQSLEKLHLHADEKPLSPEEQVQIIKDCVKDWRNLRHTKLAHSVGDLLSILTTFGWMDLAENPIKMGDFELFRARAWDVQKKSVDFLELVFDTFTFFLERGYLAFAKGDFSLLFYDDAECAAFEQEYSLLIACDGLMETGRLEDLKTEKIEGEADFENRLDNLIAKCYGYVQAEKNPHAKSLYTNRLVVLKKLRSKLIMLQKQSPVRTKPYGVCIFGGSAVGKSMVNAIITKVLLQRNGFESSKSHIVTLNDSDPYQSEFRTYHTAVTMDDFGNTKADKYEGSPTAKIIDFLNNVPKAALSPIAELKGNVMMRPKLVTATTNVKELMSGLFSNEPVSILRRFEVHLEVSLRPEWIDPETGGINVRMIDDTLVPDAWLVDLQRVRIIRTPQVDTADDFAFETILSQVSLRECLDWMVAHSSVFYKQQEQFVASTEKFYETDICEHYMDRLKCLCCNPKKLDTQANDTPFEEDCEDFEPLEDSLDVVTLRHAVHEWYQKTGLPCAVQKVKTECRTLKEAFEQHKTECLVGLFAASGSIALIYGALKMLRSSKKVVDVLNDHGRDDGVPIVLPTDHESNWKKIEITPLPILDSGRTRSREQFEELLKRRLAHCTVFDYEAGRQRSCNIFPIRGNTWLLPGHMIPRGKEVTIKVRQGRDDAVNRVFQEVVDDTKIQRFGDDYLLVRLVKGGPIPDTFDMIVAEDYKFLPEHVKCIVKDDKGSTQILTTKLLERRVFPTVAGNLEAVSYNLPIPTENGFCIAPVYTYRSPHQIIGFHLAGVTGKSFGVAGVINGTQILDALTKLNAKNSLQCHSEAYMPSSKYGIDFTPIAKIPMDHAAHRLCTDEEGQDPSALIYGSHEKGRSFFKTEVRKSPISDAVKNHLGISRDHGPPKKDNIGKHWERDLNLMAHPKGNFKPSIWNQARRDLRTKVTRFVEGNPLIAQVTFPLAHDYIMSGADGIAAFSRIPLNTSMGWPINKRKNLFIGPVEKQVPGVTEPIDFEDPMFMEEIYRMEAALSRGERIHTVFRGNLKDEPTKWTKDKIRVFAGCEIAFTYLVRKYYLPIIRLIQNNWKDFECAVGINAHGPQWDELRAYVTKFGQKRMNAGDFKHFDKSANPESMMSAFDILILIAELCGYSESELMIMRGIATEISYPIYELDGIILQLFGSNPSGHPLTVIINNVMNSLYMRYAYYKLHEDDPTPKLFDEVIALMCYGDDNLSGVSEEEDKFNMVNVVPVLQEAGILYTKADKTEVQPGDEFQTLEEVDFLKRKFVYNEPFGAYTAALDISSIGKSLHNQMVSKTTSREVIAAQAIQSANSEFAFHGPEVFHRMRPGLIAVAEECGISELVGDLPTLDVLVDRYRGSKRATDMVDEPVLDSHSDESDIVTECLEPVDREADLQLTAIMLFGRRPLLHEKPLGAPQLGTPDLVFHIFVNSLPIYVCVETKSIIKGNRQHKMRVVRAQAEKYAKALSILQPHCVLALIYTEFGFEFVRSFNTNFLTVEMQIYFRNLLNLVVYDTDLEPLEF